MDPLSDVLSLLQPRSQVSAGFEAGGAWSVRFGDLARTIKCYAIVSGSAYLIVDGIPDMTRLSAGDAFVLARGLPFRLCSDPALAPTDSTTLFPPAHAGGVVTLNGGGDFRLVGSRFAVAGRQSDALLAMLPPVVHIRQADEQAALRWAVERMRQELREGLPGADLVAAHLAHLMLVQALRLHPAGRTTGEAGWLSALVDPHLGAAIAAMHAAPERHWTLPQLAACAHLSRSAFALRFKTAVGIGPMAYLTRWRMLSSADRIARSGEPVARLAAAFGYASESAFSTAFKRVIGASPRPYAESERRLRAAAADVAPRDRLAAHPRYSQ